MHARQPGSPQPREATDLGRVVGFFFFIELKFTLHELTIFEVNSSVACSTSIVTIWLQNIVII